MTDSYRASIFYFNFDDQHVTVECLIDDRTTPLHTPFNLLCPNKNNNAMTIYKRLSDHQHMV